MRAEVVQLAQQSQRVSPCSNTCEVALAKLGRAVKVAQSSQGSSTCSHRREIALAKPGHESSLLQDPSDLLTAEDFPSETKSIRVPPSATKTNRHISSPHSRASPSDFQGHAMQACIRSFQTSVANNETVLTGTEASYIVFLLARFQKRFVDKLPYFGGIKGWEYCLKDQLKDPLRRIIRRPYPLKNPDREILFRTIEADISAGYRRNALPADIQCTAPIFVIYQRGQARVVANYQELNKNTHVDQWPCGTTDNTVDKISVSKYKAILDAKSGFSQMKKAKFTVSRTVAVTQDHTVESDGVDFGLCNALQCFCRLMHQMYHGWPSIHRHVDDLIVHSNTFKDFFQGLVNLLATAEDRNLFFKRSKLSIAPRVFRAVAHVFEGNTKRPDDSRLAPIRDIGPASTTTQTRSLLGMLNFWKDFIPNLQLLNSPIRAVLTAANARGSRKVRWTPEADAALCALKAIVCKKAFLHFPVYDKVSPESPFILHTDASGVAWGYLLTQTIDSKEFILKCGSRTFRKHQQPWHINRKELFAAVSALDDCASITALQPIHLWFDSKNMTFYGPQAKVSYRGPVYSRLAAKLQGTPHLSMGFKKGVNNVTADFMSRWTSTILSTPLGKTPLAQMFPELHAAACAAMSINEERIQPGAPAVQQASIRIGGNHTSRSRPDLQIRSLKQQRPVR